MNDIAKRTKDKNSSSTKYDEIYRPTWMQKSPRIVPGAESSGLVAPTNLRPPLITLWPSQTMATMGPEKLFQKSREHRGKCLPEEKYSTNPGKKGRPARSA